MQQTAPSKNRHICLPVFWYPVLIARNSSQDSIEPQREVLFTPTSHISDNDFGGLANLSQFEAVCMSSKSCSRGVGRKGEACSGPNTNSAYLSVAREFKSSSKGKD